MKNTIKNTKLNKNKKSIRSNKSRKMKGGSCSCNKPLFGGYGAASFQSFKQLPENTYYLPNDYKNDPSNPTSSARNDPTSLFKGGKKSKHVRFSRKKLFKGGNYDGVTNFANTNGTYKYYDMINFKNSVDSVPYVQPAMHIFGIHNPPLV
jgi:hypothetical protein